MVGVLPLNKVAGQSGFHAAIFWSLTSESHKNWARNPIDNWKESAVSLWPEFAPFLESIRAHDQMTFAHYSHGTLVRPHGNRVVHLGDAAHRASPQLGQGANMALLDALALATALETYPIHQAVGVWSETRRFHTAIYQSASWAFTPLYQSDSAILPWVRNRLAAPSQTGLAKKVLARLVCGDLVQPVRGLSPSR